MLQQQGHLRGARLDMSLCAPRAKHRIQPAQGVAQGVAIGVFGLPEDPFAVGGQARENIPANLLSKAEIGGCPERLSCLLSSRGSTRICCLVVRQGGGERAFELFPALARTLVGNGGDPFSNSELQTPTPAWKHR